MTGLSARERAALDYIAAYANRNGYPPTLTEITVGIGLHSAGSTWDVLRRLEAKGAISRGKDPGGVRRSPRAIHVTEAGSG
jgi:repressor LexA